MAISHHDTVLTKISFSSASSKSLTASMHGELVSAQSNALVSSTSRMSVPLKCGKDIGWQGRVKIIRNRQLSFQNTKTFSRHGTGYRSKSGFRTPIAANKNDF